MLGIVTSDCEGIMLVLVVNTNVKDYVLMEEESIIEVSRGLLLIFCTCLGVAHMPHS